MSRDLSQKIAELKIKTARISGQPKTKKKSKYDPSEVITLGDSKNQQVNPKYGPPYSKAPAYRYKKQMGGQIDCPQMKLDRLKLAISEGDAVGGEAESEEKRIEREKERARLRALTDDRIDPKTKKQKHKFTLLEKGEYGIGKKY